LVSSSQGNRSKPGLPVDSNGGKPEQELVPMPVTADCIVMETPGQQHIPVLLDEVIALLRCGSGGVYADLTVGGGGYTQAILQSTAPDGVVLGLDHDPEALAYARERLQSFHGRLILRQGNFARAPEIMQELRFGPADGIVADLGVSSLQLDDPARGFSFQQDGPLDMRMDQGQTQNAADLVNLLPERELVQLIFALGEDRWAKRIVRAIVLHRQLKPFTRTLELAEVIAQAVPKSSDTRRIHPATRTFQALRLAVNHELENLQEFLAHLLDLLKPGGRLCIVAFHSLEDRLVKQQFKSWASPCRCPRDLPLCQCSAQPLVRLLTRKALRPKEQEIRTNPRARSARLRAIEKI
jgi:16S rRNA (cytosine1402-N4)-methyltransferase